MQGLPIQFKAQGGLVKGKNLDASSLIKDGNSPIENNENSSDFSALFSQLAGTKTISSDANEKGASNIANILEQITASDAQPKSQLFSSNSEESSEQNPLSFLISKGKESQISQTAKPAVDGQPIDSNLNNISSENSSLLSSAKVSNSEDFVKNLEMANSKKIDPKLTLIQGGAQALALQGTKVSAQAVKNYGQTQNVLADNVIRSAKDLAFKDKKVTSKNDDILKPEMKTAADLSIIKQDVLPVVQPKENNQNSLEANTQTKVLDLSKIDTSNTSEIIKKISDYVEQNQVANKQSLDLTVKHDSLGEFKIHVSKTNQSLNQIEMQITAGSREGHDFFVKNEVSLIKNLNQAGIQLSDLRIVSNITESGLFGQSDSRQSHSFQQDSNGSFKQQMNYESQSFNSDTESGAQKRKQLWQEYQERYGA